MKFISKTRSKKIPLQVVLIVPFLIQLVGVVSLLQYFAYQSSRLSVDELAHRLLTNTSRQIRQEIEDYMATPQQALKVNQEALKQGVFDLENLDSFQAYFWQQIRLSPSLSSIGLVNSEGEQVSYGKLNSQELVEQAQTLTDEPLYKGMFYFVQTNPSNSGKREYYTVDSNGEPKVKVYELAVNNRDLEWYRYAQSAQKNSWSPIVVYRVVPTLGLFAIAPIRDGEGNFQGMFCSAVSLWELSTFLSELNFSKSGESLILERSGELVASSTLETSFIQPEQGKPRRLNAMESNNKHTQAIALALQEHRGKLNKIEEAQTLALKVEDENEFVQITPYQDEYGLDWLIVVSIPESDFAAKINTNQKRILQVSAIALIIVIGTGILTSRVIAAPIQRLSEESIALAERRWQPSVGRKSAIAEIYRLSDSFERTAEQLQKALQESEEKFATIFRTSPDPIAIANLSDGKIIEANQRQLEFLEYPRDEVIGYTTLDLGLWGNLSDREQFLQILQLEGRVSNLEVPIRVKSGAVKTALISAELCQIQDKTYLLVVTKDITERKRLEIESQASEQKLKRIFNSVSGAITYLQVYRDRTWKINEVSQGSQIISGYCPCELMSDPFFWLSRIYPSDWQPIQEDIFTDICAEKMGVYEYRIYDKSGKTRWISQTNNSTWDEEQQCWNVTAISLDISDRKQLELELQEAKEAAEGANQAKSTFLANMSHELRTPLNAILGYPQLLINSPHLSQRDREFVQIIQDSGEYLLSLINQVLDISKIEAGHIAFEPKNFPLASLLENLNVMFASKAKKKRLELTIKSSTHIPEILNTDETKLQQILVNLLNNAIKFTHQGSVTLKIELCKNNSHRLFFQVIDTGVGMHPDELKNLFQAFVQTQSGKNSQEGTGLGLVISQKFVQLLGGKLTVESELGKGTSFKFDIPIAQESSLCDLNPTDSYEPVILAPDQPQYRVLVADDNQINRQLLTTLLNNWGFQVAEAADGEEAIAQCKAWRPHLIFMDMRMPKLDGEKATQIIRQQMPDNPVVIIAVTASAFAENRSHILSLGCNDFIGKPFKPDRIIDSIKQHLNAEFVSIYTSPDSTPALSSLTMEQLRHLPQAWQKNFQEAILTGDIDYMLQLIIELEDDDPNLAHSLEALANAYDFEELYKLVDEIDKI